MKKTIRVNSKVTHNQFGSSKNIFEDHVQGKDLEVLNYFDGFYSVQVDNDVYSVCKSDVERCHHTAAHEEFNSKDNCVVEALK